MEETTTETTETTDSREVGEVVVPTWAVVCLCLLSLLVVLGGSSLYLRLYQPRAWGQLTRRLPALSKHSRYQVTVLHSSPPRLTLRQNKYIFMP